MSTLRSRALGILVLTAVFLLAGCGGGDSAEETAQNTPGETPAASIPAETVPSPFAQGSIDCYVNDEPVYDAQIDRYFDNMQNQGAVPDPEVEGATPDERLRNSARKVLIEQRLILKAAREAGITVTDQQVELRLGQIMGNSPGGADAFRQTLAAQGISEDVVRQDLREGMIIRQYFQTRVDQSPEVTDDECQTFYSDNPDQFTGAPEVHARHILITGEPNLDDMAEAELRSRAVAILKELEAGADFAATAIEKSEGPSGPTGGDLGWFGQGRMVPAFDSAAFVLDVGEVGGPVRTQFGYHLILVEEKRTTDPVSFVQAKPQIHMMLGNQKIQEGGVALLDSLRAEADIRTP